MEAKIYGVLDKNKCQIDISRSERCTKHYVSLNGYKTVSYRIGYNVFILAKKELNNWKKC